MLFWVDAETSSVRLADLAGRRVATVLGRGLFDFGDRDGPLQQALLQHPQGLAVGRRRLFVADTYNHKVKALDLDAGTATTVADEGVGLCEPTAVAWLGGNMIAVTDSGRHRVIVIDTGSGEARPLAWD